MTNPEAAPASVPVSDGSESACIVALDGDWLARRFHQVYEQMAPAFSYSTRPESAVPWDDVPRRNKALMRAVALVVEDDLRDRIAGEILLAAQEAVGWLREHKQNQEDLVRIVGAEDAYNDAIRVVRGGDR